VPAGEGCLGIQRRIMTLLWILVLAAICGLIAFLAGLLLRMRLSVLAYVGAGLLGWLIGGWMANEFNATTWPGKFDLGPYAVFLLFTFLAALLVLLIAKLIGRAPLRR
jgi:hypothetical protein